MNSTSGLSAISAMLAQRASGPDFMCIGAQKAGSRWLYDQLALHPSFWMPPIKELQLHYFDSAGPGFRAATGLLERVEGNFDKFNARQLKRNKVPLSDRDLRFIRNRHDETWRAGDPFEYTSPQVRIRKRSWNSESKACSPVPQRPMVQGQ
jgi:hypothetical protein